MRRVKLSPASAPLLFARDPAVIRPARLDFKIRRRHDRSGFSLLEAVIVFAIVLVLIAITAPAMQRMREISRRSNCEQNLISIGLAIEAYATLHDQYPIGTQAQTGPIVNLPVGYHHNWIEGLLPMLDQQGLHESIDRSVSVYAEANRLAAQTRLKVLLCPTAGGLDMNESCYAGIHSSIETPIDVDNDGVFILNRILTPDDIEDGLSYTVFVGEKLNHFGTDLGWLSGTRSTIRNAGHPLQDTEPPPDITPTFVGGLSSAHFGGVNLLMGSGEVRFRSAELDPEMLRQMASRADGEK